MKNTQHYSINQDLCTRCRLCLEVCPCNIIGIGENESVRFLEDRLHICQECAQCMAICKNKAIQVNEYSYEKDLLDLPGSIPGYPEWMDLLKTRRSVRNFRDKPVPGEIIDKILEAVAYAPYGTEPGKMHITVIPERKKIEKALPHVERFLGKLEKWLEHPVSFRMIKRKINREKFNTIRNHVYPIAKTGNYRLEYGDRISRGAPVLLIFHAEEAAAGHTENSMIYATYAMLAAHSLGLGATMIGLIPPAINKVPEVREIFGIPKSHEAVISVIIGYPKYHYKRAIRREKHHVHFV